MGLGLSFTEFHAALEAVGESALAAATRMDLRFNHGGTLGELGEGGDKARGRGCDRTLRDGHAKFFEDSFSLILVNVHGEKMQ